MLTTEDTIITHTEPGNPFISRILSFHPEIELENQKSLRNYTKSLKRDENSDDYFVKEVSYSTSDHGIGRLYARSGASLQNMKKMIRNTVCQGKIPIPKFGEIQPGDIQADSFLHDIDMENAHFVILKQMCADHGWEHKTLKRYVKTRSEIIAKAESELNVSKEEIKALFCKILYGGSLANWIKTHDLESKRRTATLEFALAMEAEMNKVREKIWTTFPEYQEAADKKKGNPRGSLLSLVLQQKEASILQIMVSFFRQEGWDVAALVFDGLMVYKRREYQDENGKLPLDVIEKCEKVIKEKTKYEIKLKEKEMDARIPLNVYSVEKSLMQKYATCLRASGRFITEDLSRVIDLSRHRWILIKSPTGTGKTQYLETAFQEIQARHRDEKLMFVAVSPRCSVTKQHDKTFNKLGFVHYENADFTFNTKIITTLDSIVKIEKQIDVLYIDEVESLLRHVFSLTLKNRKEVWTRLLVACNRAKYVICTDADMGDMVNTFFGRIFQELSKSESVKDRALFLENCLQPIKLRVFLTAKRSLWNYELEERLREKDSKIFIGCDSCSEARALKGQLLGWFEKNQPEKKMKADVDVKLYTSKDGNPKDLNNVEESWKDVKVVICSPSIIYGIDYSSKTVPFTAVMGLYTCDGITMGADEIRQQMRRIRQISRTSGQAWDVCMFCSPGNEDKETSPTGSEEIMDMLRNFYTNYVDTFKRNAMATFLLEELPIKIESTGAVSVQEEDLFVQLYVQYLRKRSLSKHRLFEMLCYIFNLEEHDVTIMKSEPKEVDVVWKTKKAHLVQAEEEDQLAFLKNFSFNNEEEMQGLALSKILNFQPENEIRRKQMQKAVRVLREVLLCDQTKSDVIKGCPQVISLLSSEKALSSFMKFRSLCKNYKANQADPLKLRRDFHYTEVTQSEMTVLNILHLVEEQVLRLKRGECIYYDNKQVNKLCNKKADIPKDVMNLILEVKQMPLAEKLKNKLPTILESPTLYDVYKWVCSIYMFFCRDSKGKSIITTKIIDKVDVSSDKKKRQGKQLSNTKEQECNNCHKSKAMSEFHKGKLVCKVCRKSKRISKFFIKNNETLADYTELIIWGQSRSFKAPNESFRTNDPIMKELMSVPTKFHALWDEDQSLISEIKWIGITDEED